MRSAQRAFVLNPKPPMTIQEAIEKLRAAYPLRSIGINVKVWTMAPSKPLDITFSVWNEETHFFGNTLEQCVTAAIQATLPPEKRAPLEGAEKFVTEAEEIAAAEPATV
jgi:hypothetical protein